MDPCCIDGVCVLKRTVSEACVPSEPAAAAKMPRLDDVPQEESDETQEDAPTTPTAEQQQEDATTQEDLPATQVADDSDGEVEDDTTQKTPPPAMRRSTRNK